MAIENLRYQHDRIAGIGCCFLLFIKVFGTIKNTVIYGWYMKKLHSCAIGKMSQVLVGIIIFGITFTNHNFRESCDIL